MENSGTGSGQRQKKQPLRDCRPPSARQLFQKRAFPARDYVADGYAGLVVLPTIPNVQFTLRVDAATNVPFTLEAATDFSTPMPWSPLLTTNVATMPFDYVDFNVKLTNKPQKFYRVRQP